MKCFKLNNLNEQEISGLTKRPAVDFEKTFTIIKPVLEDIKNNGLQAAVKYAKQFDGFSSNSVYVSDNEILEAEKSLNPKVKKALETAYSNIFAFHKEEVPNKIRKETLPGIICSREFRPIDNVGLYIPGGNAVLPSTVLMLGIPARIAACPRIVLATPVKGDHINPAILYAAGLCGIKEIIKIGGAQGIGLLAFGDSSFHKVDKIFGPGNQYVTAAKLLVSIDPEGCAIDMPAGPSELLVISDQYADPSFIASDLLSQAEHGEDSQVILVTTSEEKAVEVEKELELQLSLLPRKNIAEKSLGNSFMLITDTVTDALNFSNVYAPEHLILNVKQPDQFVDYIRNAGSVFLGEYSPESAGDYASGTNHSLPTSGFARSFGGVSVEFFMKAVSFQSLTKDGLSHISAAVETLAIEEGLFAHKNAVTIRLKK
ncbi:MAG: histidinol dehydrogenase [Ignavibacteriaceae bacterium]|nr:histidinol dehydrogenase [Ignavibacteriaceae bacterium]